MNRATLTRFAAVALAAASGFSATPSQTLSIKVDLKQPGADYTIETTSTTDPQIRAYVTSGQMPVASLAGWSAVLYYGNTNGLGIAITNTSVGANYIEWQVTRAQIATNGNFASQIVATNTAGILQEWGRGRMVLNKNPAGSYLPFSFGASPYWTVAAGTAAMLATSNALQTQITAISTGSGYVSTNDARYLAALTNAAAFDPAGSAASASNGVLAVASTLYAPIGSGGGASGADVALLTNRVVQLEGVAAAQTNLNNLVGTSLGGTTNAAIQNALAFAAASNQFALATNRDTQATVALNLITGRLDRGESFAAAQTNAHNVLGLHLTGVTNWQLVAATHMSGRTNVDLLTATHLSVITGRLNQAEAFAAAQTNAHGLIGLALTALTNAATSGGMTGSTFVAGLNITLNGGAGPVTMTNGTTLTIAASGAGGGGGGLSNIVVAGVTGTLSGSGSNIISTVALTAANVGAATTAQGLSADAAQNTNASQTASLNLVSTSLATTTNAAIQNALAMANATNQFGAATNRDTQISAALALTTNAANLNITALNLITGRLNQAESAANAQTNAHNVLGAHMTTLTNKDSVASLYMANLTNAVTGKVATNDTRYLAAITNGGPLTISGANVGVNAASPGVALQVGSRIFINDTNATVRIGQNVGYSDITVNKTHTISDIHAFEDWNILNFGDANGYSSYDAMPTVNPTATNSHIVSYQARPQIAGTGLIGEIQGFRSFAQINAGGRVISLKGLFADNPTGAGTLANNYGLYISEQTKGTAYNFNIYSDGGVNFLGGKTVIGQGPAVARYPLEVGSSSPDNNVCSTSTVAITTGNKYGSIANPKYMRLDFMGGILVNPELPFARIQSVDEVLNTAGGFLSFYTNPDGYLLLERMRIARDGNIGIGTNAPSYALDVLGDVRASGVYRGSGAALTGITAAQVGATTNAGPAGAGTFGMSNGVWTAISGGTGEKGDKGDPGVSSQGCTPFVVITPANGTGTVDVTLGKAFSLTQTEATTIVMAPLGLSAVGTNCNFSIEIQGAYSTAWSTNFDNSNLTGWDNTKTNVGIWSGRFPRPMRGDFYIQK